MLINYYSTVSTDHWFSTKCYYSVDDFLSNNNKIYFLCVEKQVSCSSNTKDPTTRRGDPAWPAAAQWFMLVYCVYAYQRQKYLYRNSGSVVVWSISDRWRCSMFLLSYVAVATWIFILLLSFRFRLKQYLI